MQEVCYWQALGSILFLHPILTPLLYRSSFITHNRWCRLIIPRSSFSHHSLISPSHTSSQVPGESDLPALVAVLSVQPQPISSQCCPDLTNQRLGAEVALHPRVVVMFSYSSSRLPVGWLSPGLWAGAG